MYIPRYKEHFFDIKKIAKENKKKKKKELPRKSEKLSSNHN